MDLNITRNMKAGFNGDELKKDMTALLAPLIYLVPTSILNKWFNINGWTAFIAAFTSTYLFGKAVNSPEICRGAVAVAGTHLAYHFGSEPMKKLNDKGFWYLDPNQACTCAMNGLREEIRTLPSGEQIVFYPADEIPQLTPDTTAVNGLSAYIQNGEPLMGVGSYISKGEPLMGFNDDFNGEGDDFIINNPHADMFN